MSNLQESFKTGADKVSKSTFIKRTPVCLSYSSGRTEDSAGIVYRFDFLLRVVTVVDTKMPIHFRDMDRDTLEFMRDKLIELGGSPPPLPAKETGNMLPYKPRTPDASI